jgi:hypothetical protein
MPKYENTTAKMKMLSIAKDFSTTKPVRNSKAVVLAWASGSKPDIEV